MQAPKNKIIAEPILEKKSEIVVSQSRHPYLKAKVLSVGEDVKFVKEGDEIVVFNVLDAHIQEYEGKKLIFVVADEAFYFKT